MGQEITDFIKNNGDTIGLVSQGADSLFSAYGDISGGMASNQASQYQASIYELNASQAAQAAQDAINNGIVQGQANQQNVAQLMANQKAAFAARGVQVNQGSPLNRAADAAMIGREDEQTIYDNAAKTALAYKMQGINYTNQANLARMRGASSETSGFIKGAGSLLSGAGSVASKWAALANKDQESPLATKQEAESETGPLGYSEFN